MPESIQHWLDRNRPPRVQITYDVETAGAIEKQELPLVVGILADLSGTPDKDNPPPELKKRKFVQIDRDNFNEILQKTAPRLEMTVPNQLKPWKKSDNLQVKLNFQSMDDFGPLQIVEQAKDSDEKLFLKELLDARGRLNDLVAKLDGNDKLEKALKELAKSSDALQQIAAGTFEFQVPKAGKPEEPPKPELSFSLKFLEAASKPDGGSNPPQAQPDASNKPDEGSNPPQAPPNAPDATGGGN